MLSSSPSGLPFRFNGAIVRRAINGVDVPQPAPDVVPSPPPIPHSPSTPPEIIEPPLPAPRPPIRDPIVPEGALGSRSHLTPPWH